ncbi:LytR C-terminal domain-containing protein [uncultured Piscinibacter sp.]|uniref:LytR C-terminal domain-containing protein n=1 Tax=uncultured Piscinibacter sp. TaxID=1131835 RepID=UPI002634235B|nr:LytR C-terminal domain-containing protein [uncultured Piscinibacter sp.]
MPVDRPTLNCRPVALAAALLVLAGCASPPPEAWRVVPSYRISHAGLGMAQGYAALARQYEGERRWEDALEAWRKAAADAPDDADILDGLGIALSGQGRLDEAVVTLHRAAEGAPASARRFNNLGYALMLAGRNDEARSVLHRALALDPGHTAARANLGKLDPRGVPATPQLAVAVASAPAAVLTLQTEPTAAALPIVGTPSARADTATREEAVAKDEAPSPPPPNLAALRVEIVNGNGVTGLAAWLGVRLQRHGLRQRARLTNLRPYDTPATVVHYRPGYAAEAGELARHLPTRVALVQRDDSATGADVRVVLGRDVRHMASCGSRCRDRSETLAVAGAAAAR